MTLLSSNLSQKVISGPLVAVLQVSGGCLVSVWRVHGCGMEHIYGLSKWCVGSQDYLKGKSELVRFGQDRSSQHSSSKDRLI